MFKLFPTQISMYCFEKLYPNTAVYHHTVATEIDGKLDLEKFQLAITAIMKRHDVLRSKIVEKDNDVYLQPIDEDSLATPCEIINTNSKKKSKKSKKTPAIDDLPDTLRTLKKTDVISLPFDFNKGLLWRCAILKLSKTKYQFLLVLHHLIVDMTSQNIILKDLSEYYNALVEYRAPILPELPALSDITVLQHEATQQEKFDYWKAKLTFNELTLAKIQPDLFEQTPFKFVGDRVHFTLDIALTNKLEEIAKDNEISINQALLAIIYILLCKHRFESDLCLGIVSKNRRGYSADIDNTVNCFINSIPLRLSVNEDLSFQAFLKQLNLEFTAALKNQLPLNVITQEILSNSTKTTLAMASPFDILCNFNSVTENLSLHHCRSSQPRGLNLHCTRFKDFGINFDVNLNGSYTGFIEYNSNLFKKQRMEQLTKHFQKLCEQVVDRPTDKIATLSLWTDEERRLLDSLHATSKENLNNRPIHEVFSQIAKTVPEQLAIVFHKKDGSTREMTYKELDELSDKLAALLNQSGIDPKQEIPVGVCIPRSPELILAFIAILKAGGIIVPFAEIPPTPTTGSLSPIRKQITDTLPGCILVSNKTKKQYDIQRSIPIFNVEDPNLYRSINSLNLSYHSHEYIRDHLAYIIFTSGTTRSPKGVLVELAGLLNLFNAIQDRNLPPKAKVLCTAPREFDAFLFEILECLATRGQLHLIFDEGRLDPHVLTKIIQEFSIQCITLLPDILNTLDPAQLPSLIDVVSMGSAPPRKMLEKYYECLVSSRNALGLPAGSIRNEYGPSEGTICETENVFDPSKSERDIGKPIRNTDVVILNDKMQECPPNITGKLYIVDGEYHNLARGYLSDHALTNEKFLFVFYDQETRTYTPVTAMPDILFEQQPASPLPTKKHKRSTKRLFEADTTSSTESQPQAESSPTYPSIATLRRIYDTGDRGHYTSSGSIVFDGRIDRQVKLHGLRIELDSIDATLRNHPDIQDLYLRLNANQDTIIAYIVTRAGCILNEQDVDNYLNKMSIPAVAWPRCIIPLDRLPKNPNGKIDTKKLPDPPEQDTAMLIPLENDTKIQGILRTAAARALGRHPQNIYLNISFYRQGGDSVSYVRFIAEIKHAFWNAIQKTKSGGAKKIFLEKAFMSAKTKEAEMRPTDSLLQMEELILSLPKKADKSEESTPATPILPKTFGGSPTLFKVSPKRISTIIPEASVTLPEATTVTQHIPEASVTLPEATTVTQHKTTKRRRTG